MTEAEVTQTVPATDLAVMGAEAREVLALPGGKRVVTAFHDQGEYNNRPYDNFKLAEAYLDNRVRHWVTGRGLSVPWVCRDALLLALVRLAVELGVITAFTYGGATVTKGKASHKPSTKPASNGAANGHATSEGKPAGKAKQPRKAKAATTAAH